MRAHQVSDASRALPMNELQYPSVDIQVDAANPPAFVIRARRTPRDTKAHERASVRRFITAVSTETRKPKRTALAPPDRPSILAEVHERDIHNVSVTKARTACTVADGIPNARDNSPPLVLPAALRASLYAQTTRHSWSKEKRNHRGGVTEVTGS